MARKWLNFDWAGSDPVKNNSTRTSRFCWLLSMSSPEVVQNRASRLSVSSLVWPDDEQEQRQ